MATTVTRLEVHIAWWVKPYLACLYVVCFAAAPFITENDPTVDRILSMHADFICRFGVRCTVV